MIRSIYGVCFCFCVRIYYLISIALKEGAECIISIAAVGRDGSSLAMRNRLP